MDIDQDTQIGADGLRHPIADIDDFQDPAPFRRRSIAVYGAQGEGQVPVSDGEGGWIWGDPTVDDPNVYPYSFLPNEDDYDDAILALEPTMYFTGAESAGVLQDLSGNDHHATSKTGTPTFDQEPFTTKLHAGVLCEGGERITIPSIQYAAPFALCGWFKLGGDSGLSANGPGLFLSKTITNGGGGYSLIIGWDTVIDQLGLQSNNRAFASAPLDLDVPHFIALSSGPNLGSSTALATVWVDGINRSSGYRSMTNNGVTCIGRSSDSFFNARDVITSNLAFWEGVELDDETVQALYATGLDPVA